MKVLVLLAVVVAAAAFQHTTEWEMWKREHGRDYHTEEEEKHRHMIWESNKQYVDEHNKFAEQAGFTLALNLFADLESAEFAHLYNGLLPRSPNYNSTNVRRVKFSVKDLPAEVDWRKKGVVSNVKNQGQCGSCWAFSTTGSLEGQHALITGKLVSLSEQQLVDCSRSFGNMGCQGGLMDNAFKYIASIKGDDTEQSYGYTAENGKCKYNEANVGAGDKSYTDIPQKNENALQEAVANVGPISCAMDASHISFQLYHSGIYDPWLLCSQTKLDHGVLAVGYGTQDSKDYWWVKNSWGPSWGMDGYFMLKRGANRCGIATQSSYPTGVN